MRQRLELKKKLYTKTNKVGNIMRNAINVTYLYTQFNLMWYLAESNPVKNLQFGIQSTHARTLTRCALDLSAS